MKKFRKLLPALSMLLISALLMGSSTFAWFSMNTSVSATGMKVQATAPRTLSISTTSGSGFANSVTVNDATAVLTPVSTADLSNWFYVKNAGSIGFDNGALKNDTTFEKYSDTATNSYYKKFTFYLKVTGGAESANSYANLFVKEISVKANSSTPQYDLKKSLRVGVKCDTTTLIFAPENTAVSYKAIASVSELGKATESSIISIAGYTKDSNVTTNIGSSEVAVEVYIWFEGQDENCKSSNAVTLETYTIDITFNVSDN